MMYTLYAKNLYSFRGAAGRLEDKNPSIEIVGTEPILPTI